MVKIQSVGVIGAGQMGNGIAHVCALAGYSVMLNDVSPDRIKPECDHQRQHGAPGRQKRISEEDRKTALGPHQAAEKYDALAGCDLVIETGDEKEEVKRKIFSELCAFAQIRRHRRDQHFVYLDNEGLRPRPTGPSGSSAFIS